MNEKETGIISEYEKTIDLVTVFDAIITVFV